MNYDVDFIESLLRGKYKEVKELITEIKELEDNLKKAKEFRATHPCKLNKSCVTWTSCWNDGKTECGNCRHFETAEQYNERMDKAYEEMRKWHI